MRSSRLKNILRIYRRALDSGSSQYDEDCSTCYDNFSEFKNELGNDIAIGIKLDKNEEDSFDSINITIEGPTSTSENIITRKEAEVLLDLLSKFLNSD